MVDGAGAPPETGAIHPVAAGAPDDAESDLITRSQRGDLQAFERLMARYEHRVYNLAYRITGNADDALDAAQETFVKIFRALPRYRQHAAFGTWVHRIAVNASLDLVRRRPQQPPVSLDDIAVPAPHNPHTEAERHETQRLVHDAIRALSPEHRTVVVLRDLQGLAYEEIAAVLRIPVGTVRSRLSRAREALRGLLGDLHHEGQPEGA